MSQLKEDADNFFAKQTRSSKIKANIVSEYFPQYCKIILRYPQEQIRYLDLFAGPGVYDDGSLSTPILVAKACAKDPRLSSTVKLIFNDNTHSDRLKSNFEFHFGENTFKHKPVFGNRTIGEDEKVRNYLIKNTMNENKKNAYPTLLFFDPFGYKGIDTKVLAEFLKNWGNELFLFVNIKRIHAAVENDKFDDLMQELFPTTIDTIRKDRKYLSNVQERLNLIIENLASEYRRVVAGKLYYTAFKFQEEDNTATSHYILHFTKHSRGYDLVKQIYHDFDNIGATLERDGTYAFDAKRLDMDEQQSLGLDFGDPNINSLSALLRAKYRGQKLSAMKLFDEHHSTGKFSRKHYSHALRKMVADNEVKATFTDSVKHTVTVLINESCILEFN